MSLRSLFLAALLCATTSAAWAEPDRAFGHFPYGEAPASALRAGVCSGAGERGQLRSEAADALARMRTAAQAAGVTLNPASCFRSIASQRALFTCASAPNGTGCRGGKQISPAQRATAVAPPGHSEHHTGFAIDFFPGPADLTRGGGCPSRDACTTRELFAQSRSGRWLAENAWQYGFEQSFFPGSTQGVMVEPWHYRFVGTAQAEAQFQAARAQFAPPKKARRLD